MKRTIFTGARIAITGILPSAGMDMEVIARRCQELVWGGRYWSSTAVLFDREEAMPSAVCNDGTGETCCFVVQAEAVAGFTTATVKRGEDEDDIRVACVGIARMAELDARNAAVAAGCCTTTKPTISVGWWRIWRADTASRSRRCCH